MITEENKYKAVWAAVFFQALQDYHDPQCVDTNNYRKYIRDGARAWFQSQRTNIGSFLYCCTILDLNPEIIRSKIASIRIFKQKPGPGIGLNIMRDDTGFINPEPLNLEPLNYGNLGYIYQ